jgi:hypothetical protein
MSDGRANHRLVTAMHPIEHANGEKHWARHIGQF